MQKAGTTLCFSIFHFAFVVNFTHSFSASAFSFFEAVTSGYLRDICPARTYWPTSHWSYRHRAYWAPLHAEPCIIDPFHSKWPFFFFSLPVPVIDRLEADAASGFDVLEEFELCKKSHYPSRVTEASVEKVKLHTGWSQWGEHSPKKHSSAEWMTAR